MSDLFHEDVPDDYIVRVADVMAAANWHTYQVLTKRSERMAELLRTKLAFAAELPHIWWGVSVENQRHGLPRIDHLRAAPAAVRFLSVEPLLEDLGDVEPDRHPLGDRRRRKRPRRPADGRATGSVRSATSAARPASRSSSSNGAACRRASTAANSTGERTTSSRR